MPLLGQAAVAMWWEIAPTDRIEFEDWHSHEHFPERLSLPGFHRGSRWADAAGGDGFFVMYELAGYETLTSAAYLARLNAPTPWSTTMMPRHRGMVRSQCRVIASHGGGVAHRMLTVRLSPGAHATESLQRHLQHVLCRLPQRAGLTAAHLLHTHTPTTAPTTTEQRIRGGVDGVADWIVLVGGYDAEALRELAERDLGATTLAAAGAEPTCVTGQYRLTFTMTPSDL